MDSTLVCYRNSVNEKKNVFRIRGKLIKVTFIESNDNYLPFTYSLWIRLYDTRASFEVAWG